MTHAPTTIYDGHGEKLGTVNFSTRSRKWFYIINRNVGPARYMDAQEATDALRAHVAEVGV